MTETIQRSELERLARKEQIAVNGVSALSEAERNRLAALRSMTGVMIDAACARAPRSFRVWLCGTAGRNTHRPEPGVFVMSPWAGTRLQNYATETVWH